MFHNDYDRGPEDLLSGFWPSILNFAEILNIFDDILTLQQNLIKQEIGSSKKESEVTIKAAKVHLKILQTSILMVQSFTEYCPCDWGRFPIIDKLIAYLDYTYAPEYFLDLMQLVVMLFRISRGKFLCSTAYQLLSLFSSALYHLQKMDNDLKKLSLSLENLTGETLAPIIECLTQNLFPVESKNDKVRKFLLEEAPKQKEQRKTPYEIQKTLAERLQVNMESGPFIKLKFLGFIHLINFLTQSDLLDELKTHIHMEAYLCRGNLSL